MNCIDQYLTDLVEELNRRTAINRYWQPFEISEAIAEECARLGYTFERRAS